MSELEVVAVWVITFGAIGIGALGIQRRVAWFVTAALIWVVGFTTIAIAAKEIQDDQSHSKSRDCTEMAAAKRDYIKAHQRWRFNIDAHGCERGVTFMTKSTDKKKWYVCWAHVFSS